MDLLCQPEPFVRPRRRHRRDAKGQHVPSAFMATAPPLPLRLGTTAYAACPWDIAALDIQGFGQVGSAKSRKLSLKGKLGGRL